MSEKMTEKETKEEVKKLKSDLKMCNELLENYSSNNLPTIITHIEKNLKWLEASLKK